MQKKLKKKSRVTEVDATIKRMNEAYRESRLHQDEHLAVLFADLSRHSALLTTAINPEKALSELRQKDLRRDERLRSLFYLVRGLEHHPAAPVREAAELLAKVLNKYGLRTVKLNYSSKSSLLQSLLQDLSQEDRLLAMGQLQDCERYVDALKEAQSDFERSRLAYEVSRSKERLRKNAVTLKAEVLVLVNERIVPYLHMLRGINPGRFEAFARVIDQVINANNEVITKRLDKPTPEGGGS